jgi:hypothetical protein
MSNEVFELIRSVFILFFLCQSIYIRYKQSKLINELRQQVISQRHDYKVMSGFYKQGLAVRDELIKAYDIGGKQPKV